MEKLKLNRGMGQLVSPHECLIYRQYWIGING